jgi:hypothetical protein
LVVVVVMVVVVVRVVVVVGPGTMLVVASGATAVTGTVEPVHAASDTSTTHLARIGSTITKALANMEHGPVG